MSIQSDAANRHIEKLLKEHYSFFGAYRKEYRFNYLRMWRFDYAVPSILCANHKSFLTIPPIDKSVVFSLMGDLELDGGTFQQIRTGHASGVGLRAWREKNNAAMSAGWRVWHYAPEEVIKAGRKTVEVDSCMVLTSIQRGEDLTGRNLA